jgi:hypothetical protein
LQLAIKLLYAESNTLHTENEVRSHPVPASGEVSLPSTWCTVQSKCNKRGKKSEKTEILQSSEIEMTPN